MLVLAACGANDAQDTAATADSGAEAPDVTTEAPDEIVQTGGIQLLAEGLIDRHQFNRVKTNAGPSIEGGILNFGLVAGSPFSGQFHPLFQSHADDGAISQWWAEAIFAVDDDFIMSQDGASTWEMSEDGRTFTFTIRDNVYWSDGTPVTAQDWVFTYEILANPEYTAEGGVRFSGSHTTVVGIMDFANGDADSIEGLRILDDRVLEIEFEAADPGLLSGGIWASLIPYHIFRDIPISEMQDHPASREEAIGFGPFILQTLVSGESAVLVANENYWRGTPGLAGINVNVINPEIVSHALRSGQVDLVGGLGLPAAQIIDNVDMNNVEWLSAPNAGYRYIGFNIGNWDADAREVVPNPNSRVTDVRLRQAMWHAIDTQSIGDYLFNGLGRAAGGLITPSHALFYSGIDRPAFDPELANQLLDEAGFLDVDGDGIREDQDGNEFILNMSWNTTDANREAQILFLVQSWEAVGLAVNAMEADSQTHFGRIQDDYEGIDLFYAGWSLGWNVDRNQTYGRHSAHNFSRFASENNDRLINASNSPEAAVDPALRSAYLIEWQEYMMEQVPVFPLLYTYTPAPVNNRINNWRVGSPLHNFLYQVAVNSDTPEVHQ